jgi:adenylate cyclase
MENPSSDTTTYVLVIDDEWLDRDVLVTLLQAAGYQAEAASSGEIGLEMIAEHPPDLVLLDVNLRGGMSGYKVCARLKSDPTTQFIPVVMVTAMEGEEDKQKAIEAGADDFVTKPYSPILLLARVRSLLRIKRLHDELEQRNSLLRQVLTRYVDHEVADVILSDPDRYLKPGGETRPVTVLFADIRGFTRYAEQADAQQLVNVLNRLFARLTRVIFEYRGTFDKYIGDEIMAFYGAPVAHEDDALNALRTAVEMEHLFRETVAELDDPALAPVGLGVGLHAGEAAVGSIGSEQAMNYTVIGDTVNTAHRVVELAGPGEILFTEAVFQVVSNWVRAVRLEPCSLPGKQMPIQIYRLLDVFG